VLRIRVPEFVDLKASIPFLTQEAYAWTRSGVITVPWYTRQNGDGFVLKVKYDPELKSVLMDQLAEEGRMKKDIKVQVQFTLSLYKDYPKPGQHGISARMVSLEVEDELEADMEAALRMSPVSPAPEMMEFQ
jgi:hypothetical protein